MAGQRFKTILLFIGLHCLLPMWSIADEIKTSDITSGLDDIPKSKTSIRQFLHVSDFHMDPNYATHKSCKKYDLTNTTYEPDDTKPYGDYFCDSPKILVKSAIEYMKKRFPRPDFILWTGRERFFNLFLLIYTT